MKGQSSLDNMLMFGLGLILAAAFFYAAGMMLSDSIAASQADEAVNKIAGEVDYVYSSGEGTVRFVDVTIPNGIEEINLNGNRVHMKVSLSSGSTDFYSNTPVRLVGSIPVEPGLERVTVRYLSSGSVQVGDLKLTTNPKSIYFYLQPSSSNSSQALVINNANFTVTGIGATLEGLSDMVTITQPSASLASGANSSITVSVNVPAGKPSGTYTGYIRVNSSNDGWDDIFVSVTVQSGSSASCTLSPSSANLSLGQTQQFTSICKDSGSSSVPCPFMAWGSDGGNMIPQNSYSSSTFVATSTSGSYVRAQNGFMCSAGITVSSGADGPLVTRLLFNPASPTESQQITVNATGDDTGRGNQNISLCQVKVDSGAWLDMSATDGAYNQVAENVTKNIGNFSAGSYSLSVRCNDSGGNWGPTNSTSFSVTAVDTQGPLVTALFTTPTTILAGNSITINATGSDSGLGDSNISLCQLSIDGGAWTSMNANDGAYNNMVENVSLSIGPKSIGAHNASVKCNDSSGNMGNTSAINFTVSPKSILFITNGASASANEQYWLTWISGHSSGLGLNWSYDTAQDSAVVAGTTNASNYKIVVMAEYDTTVGQNTTLKNYQNSGGVIVMLGAALADGPRRLGYTASSGTSDGENEIYIVNNTHYITSGFATGRLIILSSTQTNYRNVDNLGGTILADGMRANSQQAGQPALDSANRLVTWGPTRPDNFNADGNTLTTRALDYCLNASTIGS